LRKPPAPLPALALAILFSAAVPPSHADVILSELCDPQSNYTTDRYIEIYNTGASPVDLSTWKVIAVGNGEDVCTWTLSGMLNPAEAKVCGSTTATTFTVHFPSAVWATSAGYMNWNGNINDGAKLLNGAAVVDLIVAPASGLFENKTLVRNPSVTAPSPVYVASEWTAAPVTLATNASPGSHNGSAPPPAGPRLSNIVTDPASPTAGAPVHVQAAAVDTAGPVTAVTLAWGTAAASLPNVIGMPLLADSTYRTSEPIPAQAGGITVYYRVQAEGVSASTLSSVRSYTLGGGGVGAPTVLSVGQMSDSTLLVTFSEPVQETSAETPSFYTVGALVAVDAVRDPVQTSQVLVTVRGIPAGTRALAVNGVQDLDGNTASGATRSFNYVEVTIPSGYYDGTAGLHGSALRAALHLIIRNHTVRSYDYALTAFQTTDVKPNGKVWDMYSDVPGGTPPYEYSFGQTGQGAGEGFGYNREHTWPQSWFNGSSPMYSDLHMLYPTDAQVNNYRGSYPYGDVGAATITSLNGSQVGPNVSPGYSGTVFEPIDAYKGDLARAHFYVGARYLGQDPNWPGSQSTDGAQLVPWAAGLLLQWATSDPVSWKERMRNGAVYALQGNRNPFVDHPEFVALIYDSSSAVAVGGAPARTFRLRPATPNPFASGTTLVFDLDRRERVTLEVYDVRGRRVRTLIDGVLEPGSHHVRWNGRDDAGAVLDAGLYFGRAVAGADRGTARLVFVN
jgi:endonuclease I